MIRVYEYPKCTTCKKALAFLDKNKIQYEKLNIKDSAPSAAELKKMISHLDGNLRKLFNTSGMLYRELGLSEKLATLSESEAIKLLAGNGMLVKRPFILTERGGLVGFKEPEWKAFFKSR